MTQLPEQVRDWLLAQKDWLQQAADMLLDKGALDDDDVNALVEHLKTTEGQSVTSTRTFSQLMASAVQAADVRLSSISEIAGIENLRPGTPLDFGKGNLCVIYGNNGSGKSGYVRLIKKATGKPGAKQLRPNIFQVAPDKRQCKFQFHDGSDQCVEWEANSDPIDAIRSVDIFDSDAANNYLSKDNEATYTPPLVSLFDKLVGVAIAVKARLQSQQSTLVKTLPLLPPTYAATKAGAQYSGLNANSNASEVHQIQTWTVAEEQALKQLTERLVTTDPATLAKQKRATKTQLDQIAGEIKKAAAAYTSEALDSIRQIREDARNKRRIAEESAQVASAKLDGVGSETWKALWEAARNYSQTPYPEIDFPVVEDARCLLCHQSLEDDAKRRLKDFESFVQGNVERAAAKAETEYENALKALPKAPHEHTITDSCNAVGLINEDQLTQIKDFWQRIADSRSAMEIDELAEAAPAVSAPPMVEQLEATASSLNEQAVQHDLDGTKFDRAKANQEKTELEAKRWTSQQNAAITAEVQRLKLFSEYEEWIRLTNTQPITLKGGQMAEAAITAAYVARFNKELQNLQANKVKVKLVRTRAERGKAYHGLQLEGAVDGSATLEQVLSEGERRIISLAAFLADVADKPHASTFIFDDPISSLDQDFEVAVAKRLVQLANARQVVVFTHRLSLYGALEDVARKMGQDESGKEWKAKHLEQRCIETFSNASGLPVAEPIWASKTEPANNTLITRLDAAKKAGEENGSEAYRALAQGICSDFRKLIERSIEHDLLSEVVIRHRKSITTEGRISRLSNISLDDCRFIDDLMTRYSVFEHSQSDEVPAEVPDEAVLRTDLEALKKWRSEFKKKPASSLVPG